MNTRKIGYLQLIIIMLIFPYISLIAIEPIFESYYYSNYQLGQNGANIPGGKLSNEKSFNSAIEVEYPKTKLLGNISSDRRIVEFEKGKLKNKFSFDFWLMNHVNQPIGVSLSLKNSMKNYEIPFVMGIYANELVISYKINSNHFSGVYNLDSLAKTFGKKRIRENAYKERHNHLVGVYNNGIFELFQNNIKIFSIKININNELSNCDFMEISTYLENEPLMKFPNIIRYFSFYDDVLSNEMISKKLDIFKNMIDNGYLHPDKFHFNAGPLLSLVEKTSISINWETNKAANYIIEYDTSAKLERKINIENDNLEKKIINFKLENLKPETNYYYQVTAINDNDTIKSGILTFSTAVNDNTPFSFALFGDPEARPFINDRIAKQIWGERPNFIIIAGDLTDGGFKDSKYEWNYEYFDGLTQLLSRVPVYPILGNGESDKHWYVPYHNLFGKEDYYSIRYGNSEFFFVNSNLKHEFADGTRIYNWLDESLNKSKAIWKFVVMHHAPYSSDEDDYGNTWKESSTSGDLKIRNVSKLFDKYKVDFVFYGHLHCYEKSFPLKENKFNKNGTYYVLAGGGGGNLEDFSPFPNYFSQKKYRGHHYLKIDIADKTLKYYVYDINNNLIDYLDLAK